ncbi:MAG: hypothetical protein P9L90_07125 [Candidatus Aadella gelida]|nr:hypothetical protein [Candidatus Aadella gelida]
MNKRVVVCAALILVIVLGLSNYTLAQDKAKLDVFETRRYSHKIKVSKQYDSNIKGVNVNEVLSKTSTIREARSMFSGYSVKDDAEMINKKFKRMEKR